MHNCRTATFTNVKENSITKIYFEKNYGSILEINYDRGTNFINNVIDFMNDIMDNYIIKHKVLALYYLQCNTQVESTNKNLFMMITKMVNTSKNDWDDCVVSTSRTYQITYQGNRKVHAIRISIWHSTIIAYKIGHAYIIKHCS